MLGDFDKLIGICPTFARMGAKWYCSPNFHDGTMRKLAYAAGGTDGTQVVNGIPQLTFKGYPVELTEVMPSTDSNSQVACLFGNLQKAAMFGDRRGTTITFSEHAVVNSQSVFEQDEIAVRGTERFDINVHDVGTSTVAGPIVGLISQAS